MTAELQVFLKENFPSPRIRPLPCSDKRHSVTFRNCSGGAGAEFGTL